MFQIKKLNSNNSDYQPNCQKQLGNFIFPYSISLKAFIFGNFEEKKTFGILSEDDILEVD